MRVLAGIKPTDDALHLGNYFGALRQFVDLQDQHEETLCFIADYKLFLDLIDYFCFWFLQTKDFVH